MSSLKRFLSIVSGLLHIVLFPVLIGLVLSLISYLTMPGILGLALGLFISLCGFITGIIMALVIWKRRGSASFLPKQGDDPETGQQEEDHNQP